ncbi:citrate synthase/methylcitrate synthase [Gracilibacillus oryzae]|uniref:Citrate synthase n=1 Tax=Gracilibacillus oryzae TaxID=1672701 RepID=A0A7C8L1S8_9BACI|nr:citrate synthase/methylcitrate synthase [Gracilibacillus oryzae]KAB8127469.1 citrate synthase/methylcitrate synthase [Gracilibacillus oryzae]
MNFRPGLEGVVAVQTKLSDIDGDNGKLIFRGYHADQLAKQYNFEEAVHLLLYGRLPEPLELRQLKDKLAKERQLSERLKNLMNDLPEEMEMMAVLRTCISAMESQPAWPPTVEEAIRIIAIIPSILTYRYRQVNNLDPIPPKQDLDHVANYLYMMKGELPKASHVRALNAYFVLTAEHGMNAATFTSRVITSTESDLFSAITGAIGAMKGPLHGGAPSEVMKMLHDIGTIDNAEPWLRKALENRQKLMGFGHRVYKTNDPRSVALRDITGDLSTEDDWFAIARHVENTAITLLEEYKPGRKLYTNVEFYAAAVFRAVDLPEMLYTPTFTASRAAGWCAHVLEQAENNRIFRPLSEYTGPVKLK